MIKNLTDALTNSFTATSFHRIVAYTCLAGAGAVVVSKIAASRSERKPDFSVEEGYPELASLCKMEEVRPGRKVRVLVTGSDGVKSGGDGGQTVTVFLVHGSAARMAQYYDLIRILKGKGAQYRFVAFDAFGCGESPQPYGWDVYSTENHRQDLEAVFQKYANPEGRNVLLGHSYGTSQMLYLASKVDNVKGLVLIGGRTKVPDGKAHPIFNLPLWILDMLQPSLTQEFNKLAYHPSCDPKIVDLGTKMSNLNRMYMCKAFYKQVLWVDDAVVRACKHPVLVLHGGDDKVTPLDGPVGARVLAGMLEKGQLEIVEEASHQVMMEKPERCANLVHTFIQKLKL